MSNLPPLAGLSLAPRAARTGEFYPLSQAEVDELNQDDNVEAITYEPFRQDAEPVEGWHTFRVRDAEPKSDGTYGYKFYRAESLWEWYQRSEGRDPLTRQEAWYEDCVALHEKFDQGSEVPAWVNDLPRRDVPPVTRAEAEAARDAARQVRAQARYHAVDRYVPDRDLEWARQNMSDGTRAFPRNLQRAEYHWKVAADMYRELIEKVDHMPVEERHERDVGSLLHMLVALAGDPPALPTWWTDQMGPAFVEGAVNGLDRPTMLRGEEERQQAYAYFADFEDYLHSQQRWSVTKRRELNDMYEQEEAAVANGSLVNARPAAYGVVAKDWEDAEWTIMRNDVINQYEWFLFNLRRMETTEPFVATLVLPVGEQELDTQRMRDAWAKNAYDPRDVPRQADAHGLVSEYSWRSLLQIVYADLYPTIETMGVRKHLKGPLTHDAREGSGPLLRVVRLYIPYFSLSEGMRFLRWLRGEDGGLGLDGNNEDDVVRIGYMHLLDLPHKPWVVQRFLPEMYPDQDLKTAWSNTPEWMPISEYEAWSATTREAIDTSGYPAPPAPPEPRPWRIGFFAMLVMPMDEGLWDEGEADRGLREAFGDLFDTSPPGRLKSLHLYSSIALSRVEQKDDERVLHLPLVVPNERNPLPGPTHEQEPVRMVLIGMEVPVVPPFGTEVPDAAIYERVKQREHDLLQALGCGNHDELWAVILRTKSRAFAWKPLGSVPDDVVTTDLLELAAGVPDDVELPVRQFEALRKPPRGRLFQKLAAGELPPPPDGRG